MTNSSEAWRVVGRAMVSATERAPETISRLQEEAAATSTTACLTTYY
jgi:hypothetical protein